MRAIRVLKEADMVLAEDTRTSSVLLKHFDIKNRLVAHHKFNEHGTSAGIVERLKAGETIALISDAGTPGISGTERRNRTEGNTLETHIQPRHDDAYAAVGEFVADLHQSIVQKLSLVDTDHVDIRSQ